MFELRRNWSHSHDTNSPETLVKEEDEEVLTKRNCRKIVAERLQDTIRIKDRQAREEGQFVMHTGYLSLANEWPNDIDWDAQERSEAQENGRIVREKKKERCLESIAFSYIFSHNHYHRFWRRGTVRFPQEITKMLFSSSGQSRLSCSWLFSRDFESSFKLELEEKFHPIPLYQWSRRIRRESRTHISHSSLSSLSLHVCLGSTLLQWTLFMQKYMKARGNNDRECVSFLGLFLFRSNTSTSFFFSLFSSIFALSHSV